MDAAGRMVIRYSVMVADVLLIAGILVSRAADARIAGLTPRFVATATYVFAEGIIAGLLFDVIRTRRGL